MVNTLSGIAAYYENSQSNYHYVSGGTLYTTLDPATARNVITTAFVVLNLAIGVVGAIFLKARNLHRLRSKREIDRRVPLNYLTSWISLIGTVIYAFKTYQLPGGIYGLLMILTGAFGLAHQYFVNSFILPVSMQTTCNFEYGIVTTHIPNDISVIPASTFSSATTIYNAQYSVWVNGGAFGIYQKVNWTSTTFTPTAKDVIGGWDCTEQAPSTITSASWANPDSLKSFLAQQNFLFTQSAYISGETIVNGTTYKGFLAMSANSTDNSTSSTPWTVRASIANNLTTSPAPVTNLQCVLTATNPSWTPPRMPAYSSLREWTPRTYGFLMSAASNYYGFYVEWMLNAMVMVAGSGNYDLWNAAALPAGADTSYGCRVQGTQVRVEIWVILGAVVILFFFLCFANVYFVVHASIRRSKDGTAEPVLAESTLESVLDWQVALVTEVVGDRDVSGKQIRLYSYGWDVKQEKFVVGRNDIFTDHMIEQVTQIMDKVS